MSGTPAASIGPSAFALSSTAPPVATLVAGGQLRDRVLKEPGFKSFDNGGGLNGVAKHAPP